ncbi:dethiobiotin synthase [Coxiella endosymbiont of Amblyomma sculptum]|nr:dethiobiotin synthase [Coxiella endosymbiont of Amblyomma sculptum]
MTIKIFITGTDTGVGKTYISTAFLRKFNGMGFSTFGMKPVASGCLQIHKTFRNEDALALQKVSSIKKRYEFVNHIALKNPIAPNIAAQSEHLLLSVTVLMEKINKSLKIASDVFIIEGIGGWFVPLNEIETIADLVESLNIPVVLVVGIKLGCLNHTILTRYAINQKKIPLLGWIANCIEPKTREIDENINTLKKWIEEPCIGIVQYGEDPLHHLGLQPILDFFKNQSL